MDIKFPRFSPSRRTFANVFNLYSLISCAHGKREKKLLNCRACLLDTLQALFFLNLLRTKQIL